MVSDVIGGMESGGKCIEDRDPDVIGAWFPVAIPLSPPLSMLKCDAAPVILHL